METSRVVNLCILRYKVESIHQVLKEGYGSKNTKNLLLVCYMRPSPTFPGPSVQCVLLPSPAAWSSGKDLGAASWMCCASLFQGFCLFLLSVFTSLPTYLPNSLSSSKTQIKPLSMPPLWVEPVAPCWSQYRTSNRFPGAPVTKYVETISLSVSPIQTSNWEGRASYSLLNNPCE